MRIVQPPARHSQGYTPGFRHGKQHFDSFGQCLRIVRRKNDARTRDDKKVILLQGCVYFDQSFGFSINLERNPPVGSH